MREPGSGTRQVIEEHLRAHQLDLKDLNIILELENTESIKSAVASGMGVSIISKFTIQKEIQLNILREVSIQGIQLRRKLYYVYDTENLSLPSESFITFLSKTFFYQ